LQALNGSPFEVAAVVTNPDRPAGRGYEVQTSPVKQAALTAGLDVFQPDKVRDPGFAEWMRATAPDVAVVVAYGKILPAELLAIPRLGFVNLHFSLLPAYRGAAPVQQAVIDGQAETGVSVMVLTEGMDEGPVLATRRTPIGRQETAGELGDRLAVLGAELLVETLAAYGAGELEPTEQDHAAATYASKITSATAAIEWTDDPESIRNLVRGLNPVPGAWTTLGGTRLKVFRVSSADVTGLGPGEISVTGDALVAGTGGGGSLRLDDVQAAGRKRMSGADLARGTRLAPGIRLGALKETG
jgi:methionyl-tRNA formyltransferase